MRYICICRFSTPTEIQSLVLPSAVRDKLDILGAAETGSGKTLAFLIPLICRLLEIKPTEGQKKLKALILAPTRELVVQIKKYLDIFLKYTEFKAVCVVGGLSQQKQERIIKHCPEVVVATPGRFWALCEMFQSDSYLSDWSFLRVLVIDETDRMTEKGHFQELENILDRIRKEAPAERQTLVFSATLTFVHLPPHRLFVQQKSITTKDKLKQLISIIGLRPNRKVFDITKTTCTPEALVEAKMNCSNLLEKDTNVLYLLTRYKGRTLIFTNSIDASRRLHGILSKVRYDGTILMIHAKMIQKQRLVNLEKFSKTDNSVLIATDVAARGLDIPGIDHVIHYQVAKTAESYVHRSGRTARISQKGLAVMMVDPQDVKFYSRICRNLNRDQFPVFPVDNPELMEILKERVAAASQLDSLEHRMKKVTFSFSFCCKLLI
uniref:ATP-dependent RNA helicase n=1 Tax=Syphacia muris TaxID=451379 RepID=A0A0N5APZ7_9BILA